MILLPITVRNKIATFTGDVPYVCGNSDYKAVFTFDNEWDEHSHKTARFVYGSSYTDVLFEGNECPFPMIEETTMVVVGVYAGNLRTTTGASVRAILSIRSEHGSPESPKPGVYEQIMETLDGYDDRLEDVEKKLSSGGGGTGADGITPHIGDNGNWFIGDTDTGVKAEGVSVDYMDGGMTSAGVNFTTIHLTDGTTFTVYDGKRGASGTSVSVASVEQSDASGGENVVRFSDGKRLVVKNGKDGQSGKDGYTPVKGEDYFDGENGKDGQDGTTPHIGTNENWYIGNTDTGVPARGKDGQNGKDGTDGKTPEKGVDYYTDADKADMVQAVIAALPVYNGEVADV